MSGEFRVPERRSGCSPSYSPGCCRRSSCCRTRRCCRTLSKSGSWRRLPGGLAWSRDRSDSCYSRARHLGIHGTVYDQVSVGDLGTVLLGKVCTRSDHARIEATTIVGVVAGRPYFPDQCACQCQPLLLGVVGGHLLADLPTKVIE